MSIHSLKASIFAYLNWPRTDTSSDNLTQFVLNKAPPLKTGVSNGQYVAFYLIRISSKSNVIQILFPEHHPNLHSSTDLSFHQTSFRDNNILQSTDNDHLLDVR